MVEARGIEPLSENLSEGLSTSVAYALTFPLMRAHKQAGNRSSFIISHAAQSFATLVPHITDARFRKRGHLRADGCRLMQQLSLCYLCQLILTFPDFSEARGFGSLIRHP